MLKEILGHRTIRMTMRYVHVTQRDLQREYLATLAAIEELCSRPILSPGSVGTIMIDRALFLVRS